MKRQPGLETAQKLSILQKNLDSKTRKMKEFAGEINMYQAKVLILLFRQINLSMTFKELRKKSKRLDVNIMSKRKENKLVKRTKRFYTRFDCS